MPHCRFLPGHLPPLAGLALAALVAGCGAVQAPQGPNETESPASGTVAGWYIQDASGATLQPCGSPALAVVDGVALRERAHAFGLQDGHPVYVRVHGDRTGTEFRPGTIEQFGSPVPVRDCPMTGTNIQR